jgi:hypothetical protein
MELGHTSQVILSTNLAKSAAGLRTTTGEAEDVVILTGARHRVRGDSDSTEAPSLRPCYITKIQGSPEFSFISSHVGSGGEENNLPV